VGYHTRSDAGHRPWPWVSENVFSEVVLRRIKGLYSPWMCEDHSISGYTARGLKYEEEGIN
jgi:hypothetical protein